MVELTAIKAKHGDSLLLRADGATVLIDGGPPGAYRRFVKEHLEALDPGGEDPPELDLVMVSHVDSDHIAGILDLTSDLIDADDEETRPLVSIRRAWVNSFADTIATASGQVVSASAGAALGLESVYDEEAALFASSANSDARVVLSSVNQGRSLRRDLKRLAIEINRRFDDRLAIADASSTPWERGALSLDVVGPTQAEVEKLRTEWARQLPKIRQKEAERQARTEAARSLDTSVFNLASIVAIAKADGKTILLTGDARGDMILGWLEAAGHAEGRAHFDVLKLPHHGSDRNVTPEFFQKVTADHYVVCGDGKHGNPEPHTFEMLFDARPDESFDIWMTYGPDELAEHPEFLEHDNPTALAAILDVGDRRDRLHFPAPGETAVTLNL